MHAVEMDPGSASRAQQTARVATPRKIANLCLKKQAAISALTTAQQRTRKPHSMRFGTRSLAAPSGIQGRTPCVSRIADRVRDAFRCPACRSAPNRFGHGQLSRSASSMTSGAVGSSKAFRSPGIFKKVSPILSRTSRINPPSSPPLPSYSSSEAPNPCPQPIETKNPAPKQLSHQQCRSRSHPWCPK